MKQYSDGSLLPKLYRIIGSHTVLIYNKQKNEIATGLYLKYKDHFFILTAKHVVEGKNEKIVDDHEDIIISFGSTPSSATIRKTFHCHATLDAVAIQLDSDHELVIAQHSKYYEPGPMKLAEIKYENFGNIYLCGVGLPIARTSYFPDDNVLLANTLFFSGNPMSGLPQHLSHINYDKSNELWVDMSGTDFYNEFGEKTDFHINPHGMSGCAIWLFDPETVDARSPCYSLLGIQSSVLPHHRYLKIVGIVAFYNLIEHLLNP